MVLRGTTILACGTTLFASGIVLLLLHPSKHTHTHTHLNTNIISVLLLQTDEYLILLPPLCLCERAQICESACIVFVCVCDPEGKEMYFCILLSWIFALSTQVFLECLEGRMVGFAGEVGWMLEQAKAVVLPFKDNQLS